MVSSRPWSLLLLAFGCAASDGAEADATTSGSSSTASVSSTATTPASTDPDSTADTSSSTTTTPAEDSSTGPMPCVTTEDCGTGDPLVAFCVDNACTNCGATPNPNAACASVYPAFPVCVGDECVRCTADNDSDCQGTTPVCDTVAQDCVACSDNSECPDSACDFEQGNCFPTSEVVYVDNTFTGCEQLGVGLPALPFCEIADAASVIDEIGTIVIAGGTGYGQVTVDGKRVAIVGDYEVPPAIQNLSGPGLIVDGDAVVFVDGLRISNSDLWAVQLIEGQLWLYRSQILNNSGSGGIEAHAKTTLRLRNSLVAETFGGDPGLAAIRLDGAHIVATFSTITNNFGNFNEDGGSILCTAATGVIRNSIVTGIFADSIAGCGGVTFSNNAVDTAGLGTQVGAHDDAWFDSEYRLTQAGATVMADIAQWVEGDPRFDIDGQPRQMVVTSQPGWDQPDRL